MELRTMYPPQKDSPTTFLLGAITNTDTFAIVGNAGLLPQVYPYPLTIGPDRPITETVMVTEIDLPTNRITFTRGTSALPWSAGTTLGRVFTAQDLKTVQDNIVDIYDTAEGVKTDVTNLGASVTSLETIVGDSSSGIVKNLEDEIVRAKFAESTEVTRATTAEGNLETKKINRTELPQIIIDASYSADATKLKTTLTRYNASNQETGNYERILPLITTDSVGLMTPEAYNEITALRTDVMALQQQGGKFIGISFDTKAALDGYDIPDSVKLGDFTYVLDDEDHADSTTRYVFNGIKFDFAFVVNYDPVGLANDRTPGLVKSTDGSVEGKVFVEADGTMSTVGWDELIASVDGLGGIGRTTETVKGNADALYDHEISPTAHGIANKVDKVAGKQLSDTNYTIGEKMKLEGIKPNANVVANSATNGNIIIDGTQAVVYSHPAGTNPHGTTKIDINLGNVDNIKQMPISGGTFTGNAIANVGSDYTTKRLRNSMFKAGTDFTTAELGLGDIGFVY